MQLDGGANDGVFRGRVDEVADARGIEIRSGGGDGLSEALAFAEEHGGAQLGMATRDGVAEGVPAANLLEATHVVEEAAEPGEVDVGGGPALLASDAVAEVCHVERVRHLERDAWVGGVIRRDVGEEGGASALAVDGGSGVVGHGSVVGRGGIAGRGGVAENAGGVAVRV